jgi:hypothetical protein
MYGLVRVQVFHEAILLSNFSRVGR